MTNLLVSFYLAVANRMGEFMAEERGDAFTTFIITCLIVIVMGVGILGVMRVAVPDLMTEVVTRIRTLYNP